MGETIEIKEQKVIEIPGVEKKKCSSCEKDFKVADRVVIESRTEKRYHIKCFGDGKGKYPAIFVGTFQEKDSKVSTIDRDRISRRLKKIKRQVKVKNREQKRQTEDFLRKNAVKK